MNTYKNDKNINKERVNIHVNVQKLQVFLTNLRNAPIIYADRWTRRNDIVEK